MRFKILKLINLFLETLISKEINSTEEKHYSVKQNAIKVN
jgi:hypothetical protein